MEYKAKILLVDDDPKVINSLKRVLNSKNYELISTTSSEKAINILSDNNIDMIICDQNMPNILGVDILKYAKKILPDAVRILITGAADINVAISAINEGNIYYFFSKPWNNEEIKKIVRKGLDDKQEAACKKSLFNLISSSRDHLRDVSHRINSINDILETYVSLKQGAEITASSLNSYDPNKQIDQKQGQDTGKIYVMKDEKIILINTADVIYLAATHGDVIIATKHEKFISPKSLNYWEKQLSTNNFFRCHRSYIINIDHLFAVLGIVAAAMHKVNTDRYYNLNKQLQEAMESKKKIADAAEKLKLTLDQLRKTQEQLIHQEKLASIGQLAAGVAHEINNPLSYISSNFETSREYFSQYKKILLSYQSLLKISPQLSKGKLMQQIQKIRKLEAENNINYISADMDELFNDIDDGLKSIKEILMSLGVFARSDPDSKFEDFDLNKSIKRTLVMAQNQIKNCAQVVKLLGNIPIIKANSSRINQVLLNIILNASYAVKIKNPEAKGRIIVSTSVLKGYVQCEIEDNGTGIEEKSLK